jgi:hypothetical protein
VSFTDAAFGGLSWGDATAYLPAQVAGCTAGAVLANLMFALPAVSISDKHRASGAHFLSEVIATLRLLLVIVALARSGRSRSAYLSGEVTSWRTLAHRTLADLEAAGMRLRLDTIARRIDVPGRKLLITSADGAEELLGYDKLIVGTGAVPVRPPIAGLAGPAAIASRCALPATAPLDGCWACSYSGTGTPRSPSGSTSPPPPSSTT